MLVIGADTTAVRLVEELVRAGEQLVVLAYGQPDPDVITELEALGATVTICASVRERDLRGAGIEQARSVVILGDDDVRAVRIALMVEDLTPGHPAGDRDDQSPTGRHRWPN